jgi:hypothetical protein
MRKRNQLTDCGSDRPYGKQRGGFDPVELLLFLVLIGLLAFGYQWHQDWRERKLAARLERLRDPNAALFEVDRVIVQSQAEADRINRSQGRIPYL